MNDNQKCLFRYLFLIPIFFIAYLLILVRCKNKVGAACVWRADLAIKCLIAITVLDSAKSLKGSQRMGTGDFSKKNHRAPLFNDDLSSESTFGGIHLAGQYGTFKQASWRFEIGLAIKISKHLLSSQPVDGFCGIHVLFLWAHLCPAVTSCINKWIPAANRTTLNIE